ncbi:MAG TPA: hypothetical protein VF855_13650 [Acidimicrobiales bacterium]
MPLQRRDGYRLWVGGPVPPGSSGITLGSLVIVRAGAAGSRYLLRHEEVHVAQWRHHGLLGFSARYLAAYVGWRLCGKGHRGAYRRIPFEVEADWVARRVLAAGAAPAPDPAAGG